MTVLFTHTFVLLTQIKEYVSWVAFSDMTFVPSFMKIHHLVQELLGGNRQLDMIP